MERIYIFTRFERFWHWTQALLVIGMMITGFEIHGTYNLLGFEKAHEVHTLAAWVLITLWVFAIFWHFITGEWRQYIPTMKNADVVLRHYAWGIFNGEPHPFKVTRAHKHNPLQAQAYLGVKLLINPILWISGLAYLYYNELAAAGQNLDLATIALIHTLGAFMMLAFFIAHVYLITTGHTVTTHIKAMITGWEDAGEEHGKS
jgi:thiosulfate reductase cytochrome b subunit